MIFNFAETFFRDYSSLNKSPLKLGIGGTQLLEPCGMAADNRDRIYFVDAQLNLLQCVDCEGTLYFRLGSQGMGKGKFNEPRDVAFDHGNQRLLVSDSQNHRIQIFDLNGRFRFSFGIKGKEKGAFMFPQGIAVDRQGYIYVADQGNNRVQIFNRNGTFLKELLELKRPGAIGIMSSGKLVVSNQEELMILDPKRGSVQLKIQAEQPFSPLWLCLDSQDNILVCNLARNSLFIFSQEGRRLGQLGEGLFSEIFAVAMSRKGDILISAKKGQKAFFFVY